jgi:Zn-dependent peptidase ImmA (M78 family)
VATLARRSKVPRASLEAALLDEGELDENAISSIADELAVPIQALFARQELPLFPAVDFRSATPATARFKKGVLEAISFVERISSTVSALSLNVSLDKSLKAIAPNLIDGEAIDLAQKWRKRWGMTNALQLELHDANKIYTSLRSFIENLGVLVLHRSFGTDQAAGIYAHIEDGPHTIVINSSKSSKARKLFTLAHEFCHVLLRAEGASNPSVLNNSVERFCNKFAAYLLAPDTLVAATLSRYGYVPSANSRTIRLIAEKMGISQEATVLRLVETNNLTQSDYTAWRSQFNGVTPPADLGEGGGGGGASDPLQTKRTAYGTRLLGLLGQAYHRGQLDELDIYRLCGLKPKYQHQLFEAA